MVFIVGNCTQHKNDQQRKVPIYGILGPSGPMTNTPPMDSLAWHSHFRPGCTGCTNNRTPPSGATPDDISICYLELLQPPRLKKTRKDLPSGYLT